MTAVTVLTGPALPSGLADLPFPPSTLYLSGSWPVSPLVAIVGTRRPSWRGRLFAKRLAAELARAGIAVASGGASGIDAAAHRGTLEAGGIGVVVAPSGVERPYPAEHQDLFAAMLGQGGAYLSLVPPHVPARQSAFFQRNACLVALCQAVVIVEAPLRSGARNAAAWARRIGRPLFAVPGAPWHAKSRGCLEELRLGAKLLTHAKELLNQLEHSSTSSAAFRPTLGKSSREATPSAPQLELFALEPATQSVLDAVRAGATHADAVCESTGLDPAAVQQALLHLTLAGHLARGRLGELRFLTC